MRTKLLVKLRLQWQFAQPTTGKKQLVEKVGGCGARLNFLSQAKRYLSPPVLGTVEPRIQKWQPVGYASPNCLELQAVDLLAGEGREQVDSFACSPLASAVLTQSLVIT